MRSVILVVAVALSSLVVVPHFALVNAAAEGWVKVDLLDDKDAPDGPINHNGLDIVSAIWFRDPDHGIIGTLQGDGDSGGAIFRAARGKLTGMAFRGYKQAVDGDQNVGFRGFVPFADGVVALLTRADTYIHGDNDFKFTRESPGRGRGVEAQLWEGPVGDKGKWMSVTGTGVVSVADESPGKGVEWKVIWFPEGNPPIPDPVPDGMCPEAAIPNTPVSLPFSYAYVSPDGQTIVYPLHDRMAMCVCHDGGKTWLEKPLPNAPASIGEAGPYGLYFADKMTGWAFYGNDLKDGSACVYCTTDGGDTWKAGKLPDEITAADSRANCRAVFFAPDKQHGWLVGYRGDATIPMLLRSSDGGTTWQDKSTGKTSLATVAEAPLKLYCGWAIDQDHIWVGGGNGGLFYCDTASR